MIGQDGDWDMRFLMSQREALRYFDEIMRTMNINPGPGLQWVGYVTHPLWGRKRIVVTGIDQSRVRIQFE